MTSSPAVACSEHLANDTKLRQVLRLPDLVLLIIGTVIGSGIFLVPGLVLKAVGNSLLVALSVWLVGDRKSTRLNSSHQITPYSAFCFKKKKHQQPPPPSAPT